MKYYNSDASVISIFEARFPHLKASFLILKLTFDAGVNSDNETEITYRQSQKVQYCENSYFSSEKHHIELLAAKSVT